MITAQSKDRILSYIDQGEADGASVVVDGRGLSLQGYENGFFVGGTLLDHVKLTCLYTAMKFLARFYRFCDQKPTKKRSTWS